MATDILIVDDEQLNLELATRLLRREGFAVRTARDGREALRRLSERLPDAVLTDLHMPYLDGIAFIERIRATPAWAHLPVVACTASRADDDAVAALEAGADDLVVRPFSNRVLVARLRVALRSAQPPAPTEFSRGAMLLDRYRLVEPVGEGGQGSVWRATQLHLQRDVAIKVLSLRVHTGAMQAALLREGVSACRVQHPGAVAVHAFELTPDGIPFLVMEWLEGRTLAEELVAQGPLPPAAAVAVFAQVARTLEAAHGSGVVHRDVKPSNLLLLRQSRGGVAKVLDFGIARLEEDSARSLGKHESLRGTPAYLAPEVLGGEPPHPGQDVYALGLTLYEALRGQHPLHPLQPGLLALVKQHIDGDVVPLQAVVPGLPDGLSDLVLQMLSVGPADRPTAAQVAAALTSLSPEGALAEFRFQDMDLDGSPRDPETAARTAVVDPDILHAQTEPSREDAATEVSLRAAPQQDRTVISGD